MTKSFTYCLGHLNSYKEGNKFQLKTFWSVKWEMIRLLKNGFGKHLHFTAIFLIYKKANKWEEISKNNFIALFYSRLMPGIQTAKALGTWKGHYASIIKSHSIKNVSKMSCVLIAIRQSSVWRKPRIVFRLLRFGCIRSSPTEGHLFKKEKRSTHANGFYTQVRRFQIDCILFLCFFLTVEV